MATNNIFVTGTAYWAKTKTPDTKFDEDGIYSVVLYVNKENAKKVKDSGLRIRPKKDENGVNYTFRRKAKGLIRGDEVEFGPPKVVMSGESFDGFIGNGSDVTLKVSVYDTKMGKGHRLEAIRVNELVEYHPKDPFDDEFGDSEDTSMEEDDEDFE